MMQELVSADVHEFVAAASSDIEVLASLHDREPTAQVVSALHKARLEDQLGLVLSSEPALAGLAAFALAVDELPNPIDTQALDELAAGFADVYLRYTYRAAPEESVWLTEDALNRQAPMFEVREFYRRNRLRTADWANRADDHLVIELGFLSRSLGSARTLQEIAEAVRFLDQHVLRWVKKFAVRLVQAGAPNWYAALALVTASYLDELRDHLGAITGIARPQPAPDNAKAARQAPHEDAPYVPGGGPSW